VERTTQQVIGVARSLKLSKILRDNKNKSKQQTKTNKLVRVVPNNERKKHKSLGKPHSQYVTILLKPNTL
jgi:hypothetical protein